MNKLKLVLLLFTALTFITCKKEEDEPKVEVDLTKDIVGLYLKKIDSSVEFDKKIEILVTRKNNTTVNLSIDYRYSDESGNSYFFDNVTINTANSFTINELYGKYNNEVPNCVGYDKQKGSGVLSGSNISISLLESHCGSNYRLEDVYWAIKQ